MDKRKAAMFLRRRRAISTIALQVLFLIKDRQIRVAFETGEGGAAYWALRRQKRFVLFGAGRVTAATGWVIGTVAWSHHFPSSALACWT